MKTLLTISGNFMALCLSSALYAAEPASSAVNTITVNGEAFAQVTPDQAVLSLSVVSRDAKLEKAKEDNDRKINQVVEITNKFNIKKEKVATSNLYIAPEYAYDTKDGKQERRQLGYVVNRSLRITIDALELHEKLLSALVAAKIDEVNNVQFQLSDPNAHSTDLRVKAFAEARTKAEALAKAAGGTLGHATAIAANGSVSPIAGPPRPMMMMAKMAESAAPEAPSLPGMIALQESVTATFALDYKDGK